MIESSPFYVIVFFTYNMKTEKKKMETETETTVLPNYLLLFGDFTWRSLSDIILGERKYQ